MDEDGDIPHSKISFIEPTLTEEEPIESDLVYKPTKSKPAPREPQTTEKPPSHIFKPTFSLSPSEPTEKTSEEGADARIDYYHYDDEDYSSFMTSFKSFPRSPDFWQMFDDDSWGKRI